MQRGVEDLTQTVMIKNPAEICQQSPAGDRLVLDWEETAPTNPARTFFSIDLFVKGLTPPKIQTFGL